MPYTLKKRSLFASIQYCQYLSTFPQPAQHLTFSFFFFFAFSSNFLGGHRNLHGHRLARYQILAKWTRLFPVNAADFPQAGEKWRGANQQLSSAVETCKTGQWTYRQIAEWCTSHFKRKTDCTVYSCPNQPKETEASLRMVHHIYFAISGQNNPDNLIYIYFFSVPFFLFLVPEPFFLSFNFKTQQGSCSVLNSFHWQKNTCP